MSTSELHIPFLTTKHLAKEVKAWLSDLKLQSPRIESALDAPAGAGALTKFLMEEVCSDVVPVELDAKKWKLPSVPPVLTDLGRPLPFNDKKFDLVICMEGLKHLTDVATAISEFSRVLKNDGRLLLTIPNDLCMQSRARYFLDGWVDTDWISPMDLTSQNEKDHFHLNSLVSLPYLYYLLEKSGLRIVKTGADRFRFWSVVIALICYPAIYLATVIKLKRNHPLRTEMISLKWLAGRRNLILCEKQVIPPNERSGNR